jgi:hypothetical protein
MKESAMAEKKCGCGEDHGQGGCAGCDSEQVFSYYCESCERSVPEKRCPYCGLKARKKRDV